MQFISQISTKKRLLAIGLLITFIFVAVLGKLFYIQIIDGVDLQAKALDQWTRDVPIVATRGKVYSANGTLLAGTTTTYTLFVRRASVKDFGEVASVISEVVGLEYDKVYEKISKKGVSEVKIARNIDKETMQKIKSSGAKGIYFSADTQRFYPYGDFLSAVLGFTNVDTQGQTGLELYYNQYLTGTNGYELTQTDLIGRELNSQTTYIPAIDGFNLFLSIDEHIQQIAETAVKSAVEKYSAKSSTCLIMNAKTGGISAIAQAPSFDLNNLPRDDVSQLMAKSTIIPISTVFEPGSTFKILTLAIAINEGKTKESDTFFCPGYRMVDGQRIKCWKSIGHGTQTLEEGVCNSCNCVFMDLAQRVGVEKLYSYYKALGLTSKTGIDLNGETSGILLKQDLVKTVDLARIGFGQAIAITPLGLIRSVSSIVNGGRLVNPRLATAILDKDGKEVYKIPQTVGDRIISEETSERVRKLLKSVVSKGSGKHAGVVGYSIGGKTGTAQKYENGHIAQGKYLSSFIGFSTVEDPEYVVLFTVDEPQGYLYYGSLVAAPYVGEIFSKIFSYKQILPTEPYEVAEKFYMPDLTGLTLGEAVKELRNKEMLFELEGEKGVVVEQFPYPNTICDKNAIAYIKMSDTDD